MRRLIHPAQVAAFVGFFAVVMAVGLLLKDYATQASLQQVRAAVYQGSEYDAQTAKHSELDGLGMPHWNRWGWKLTGGRTDQLEDRREAITGFYHRGKDQIAYTVIAGTGSVDDGEIVREVDRTPPEGKTALTLGGATSGFKPSETVFGTADDPAQMVLSVRRKIGAHTVVLTGSPLTDQLLADMQDMALRVNF